MPPISYLFSRWWKQILFTVVICLAAVGALVYVMPLQYLSVATAVPGSSLSADKARIFSRNIQALYSDIGLPDELDLILGTGQLDTIYLAVTDEFNLYDHYKYAKEDGEARGKSARKLKKNSKVIKSDYGELKIKVWNTDRNLAPQLANALMNKLQEIHQELQSNNNKKILRSLQLASTSIQIKMDSLSHDPVKGTEDFAISHQALLQQLQDYRKLENEYALIINTSPESLLITEKARPALWPDRPKRIEILLATGILSLLFAFLVALLLDRRKGMIP